MKKFAKSTFVLFLILIMVFMSCVACEDTEDPTDVNESTSNTDDAFNSDSGTKETEKETEKGTEVLHKVTYKSSKNGSVQGTLVQMIEDGKATTSVRAVADEGYVFAGWSDGETNPVRKEKNVNKNITVYAKFVEKGSDYTVTYEIRTNGYVVQTVSRTGKAGESIQYAPAEPSLGYVYSDWSDGKISTQRVDTVVSAGKTFSIELEPHALNVPTIEISTEDGTGITDRENYKNCSVTLSNVTEGTGFENIPAQIRGRGNSSWSYPKKGFRLKFDNKRSMLGSDYRSKTWIFISNYGDKSLIRNMIAYDMSDAFDGLDYTVTHKFIDVYVDGEYYGLFMLTDKIDVGEGKLELDETIDPDPAKTAFIIEVGASTEVDNYVKGVDYFTASRDYSRGYYLNYPETDDPAYVPEVHLAYIEDYVDQCLKALSDQDWDKICELMDVESFTDYYILQELFMNKDGFWRSVYFYKEPNGKLYAGPLWDMDQGAGNGREFYAAGADECTPDCDIDYVNSEYHKVAGTPWIAGVNTWYRRMMRNEEFKSLLCERLELYGPVIMTALEKATTDGSNPNSYYSLYGAAMERNFERWKIMGTSVWPNSNVLIGITTVEGQIDYMREWLIERYNVLCNHYGVDIQQIE